jgi:ABC-type transport system involved in cytochrome bd biosynthesis fused ATPase/permease subunit
MPTVLGLEAGLYLWALFGAAGLAALVAASEVAFIVLRVIGAGFLLYLGVGACRAAWRSRKTGSVEEFASRAWLPTVGAMQVIRCEGLSKRYGSTVAVDGLDLVVEAGQVFGFLGPNGSGKTTTMRMLLGLIAPTAGRAWVNERPLPDPDGPDRARRLEMTRNMDGR